MTGCSCRPSLTPSKAVQGSWACHWLIIGYLWDMVIVWKQAGPVGQVAQLVEQWTENPRVGGSSPPLTTTPRLSSREPFFIGFPRFLWPIGTSPHKKRLLAAQD